MLLNKQFNNGVKSSFKSFPNLTQIGRLGLNNLSSYQLKNQKKKIKIKSSINFIKIFSKEIIYIYIYGNLFLIIKIKDENKITLINLRNSVYYFSISDYGDELVNF